MHTARRLFFKSTVIIIILFLVILALTSCSQRQQIRWGGNENLGDLPTDMLYIEGLPQIVTISTESDGDIVFVYLTTDNQVKAQLYGCPQININCTRLERQGSYYWTMPGSQ